MDYLKWGCIRSTSFSTLGKPTATTLLLVVGAGIVAVVAIVGAVGVVVAVAVVIGAVAVIVGGA